MPWPEKKEMESMRGMLLGWLVGQGLQSHDDGHDSISIVSPFLFLPKWAQPILIFSITSCLVLLFGMSI